MKEYYIVANSFAAPFFSDTSTEWVMADDPEDALVRFRRDYGHPSGLYAAACYRDANACSKHEAPLASWRSPEAEKAEAR